MHRRSGGLSTARLSRPTLRWAAVSIALVVVFDNHPERSRSVGHSIKHARVGRANRAPQPSGSNSPAKSSSFRKSHKGQSMDHIRFRVDGRHAQMSEVGAMLSGDFRREVAGRDRWLILKILEKPTFEVGWQVAQLLSRSCLYQPPPSLRVMATRAGSKVARRAGSNGDRSTVRDVPSRISSAIASPVAGALRMPQTL